MKNYLKALTGVAVLTAVAIAVPVAQAAPLLSRVNQAMRDAGIAVTGVNQLGWGEGVVVGHYKSYGQLVDAMKWHKQQGRYIPDSSKFTKAVAKAGSTAKTTVTIATGKTKCMNSVRVNSMSNRSLSVEYSAGKFRTIKLTTAQYNAAIGRSVQNNSTVKVCSKDNFKTLTGNVIGVAGLANTTDGGSGGGGGGGGGGGSSSGT